jgi:signal transduction histidine kinase
VLIANAQSGQIVLVNDQVEKIWDRPVPGRMTVKDYVGWEGFHLPDGRPYEPSERPLVRALSRGEVVMGEEYEILRRDGSRATIQVNAGPLTNSAGTVVEGVVIFQDVTPRRRAEDGLRFLARSGVAMSKSLELDSVLTSLAKVAVPELGSWCSIYMAEGEGDNLRLRRAASTSINPANAILLEHIENRYPPDQGDPQGVAEVMRSGKAVLHPELPEGALAAMAQSPEHLEILRQLSIRSWMGVPLVVRGRTQGVMVLATTGHDRRYEPRDLDLAEALSLRAALAIENARLYREAEREIEARKLAEEEVRNLNAHLEGRVKERTAELEETVKRLDSFAYSVAHDFRAPLRGVSGLGLILIQEYAGRTLDAEALDYLHRMTACAQKMDTLISDLLSYSRVTRASVQIESVETDSLVVGVVEQLKELLRERKASVNVRRDLPPVMGHHQMLAHAVSNLLTNAVKFVAPGIQPKVDIWAEPRGDSVRLWIQDNGIGIEPDYHDRIFGIFQRLNPLDIYPGTGIGLAIARAAIERIGGRVGVESNLGEGSRFWIELPKVRPAG